VIFLRRPPLLSVLLVLAAGAAGLPAQEGPIATATRLASDDSRPLWEVGLAGLGAHVADYPGADQSRARGFPVPYFIYRGETLRAGDGGIVRGRLRYSESLEFDLSFDGSLSADSDDNTLRRGMPDLDFLGEIGPQAIWRFWREGDRSLTLNLPLRSVLSFGSGGVRSRGAVFNPRLAYRDRAFLGGTTLSVSVGTIFASEKLMDYFYEVRPEFVRPGRPAYDARGGYLGSEVSLNLSRTLTPRLRAFAGTQIGLFGGAANRGSVLLARDVNWNFAAGFAWSLWESDRRAGD
jgi:MipA family protein